MEPTKTAHHDEFQMRAISANSEIARDSMSNIPSEMKAASKIRIYGAPSRIDWAFRSAPKPRQLVSLRAA